MGNTIEQYRFFGHTMPKVDNYFRGNFTLTKVGDIDAREGLGLDGVVFGKYTPANYVGYGLEYDDSAAAGSQYSDVTADLNATGTEEIFTQADEIGDALYIGEDAPFGGVVVDIATAGVGATAAVTWEYYNGTAWTNLATAHELVDDSTSFKAGTSSYVVSWKIPSDWVTTDVGDAQASFTAKYWIRARVTTAAYTTSPVLNSVSVMSVSAGTGVPVPFTGYLTDIAYTANVEADDDDLELNIVNLTRGTSTTATILQDTRVGRVSVAITNGLYFEKDDELLLQATSTATAEIADVNLNFQFKV